MKHIFIVNPYAGKKNFADNIRSRLGKMNDLDYLVFNTRYKGYETELVQKITKMFPDEKLRFYCCGGSGTFRNMLNGFPDISKAEIAFYPCGLSNDFLKCFKEKEKMFHSIEELIHGDVIRVDYIETNHGRCINTCSTGVDMWVARIMNYLRITQVFGDSIPYVIAILISMLTCRRENYQIDVDGKDYSGLYMEVFHGNGHMLGSKVSFVEHATPDDGKLGCAFYSSAKGIPTIQAMIASEKNDFEFLKRCGKHIEGKCITLRHKDGTPVIMNQDGELVSDVDWKIQVVPNGLHLVVPKGVRL